ncbi:MAG: hypothetical protein AcusKO_14640 [Acuticoccus sp.]
MKISPIIFVILALAILSAGVNLISIFAAPPFTFPVVLQLDSQNTSTWLAAIIGVIVGASIGAIIEYFFKKYEKRYSEKSQLSLALTEAELVCRTFTNISSTIESNIINANKRGLGSGPIWLKTGPISGLYFSDIDPSVYSIFVSFKEYELHSKYASMVIENRILSNAAEDIMKLRSELDSYIEYLEEDSNGMYSGRISVNNPSAYKRLSILLDGKLNGFAERCNELSATAMQICVEISRSGHRRFGSNGFPVYKIKNDGE